MLEQELCIATFQPDALIEAVYGTEVEKLAAAERKFTEAMPPYARISTQPRPAAERDETRGYPHHRSRPANRAEGFHSRIVGHTEVIQNTSYCIICADINKTSHTNPRKPRLGRFRY